MRRVEIDPISALYYKIHTISILQVRKLVIQFTSTSTSTSQKTCNTSYKYKYKYKLQVTNYRPQESKKNLSKLTISTYVNRYYKILVVGVLRLEVMAYGL